MCSDETRLQKAFDVLDNGWKIGDKEVAPNELILGEIR